MEFSQWLESLVNGMAADVVETEGHQLLYGIDLCYDISLGIIIYISIAPQGKLVCEHVLRSGNPRTSGT